jgi:hypothetical protein
MQHVFEDHIRQIVEAYVDDIIVKTRKVDDLVNDLRITFDCLQANGVKLNPEKYVFEVPRGMLLGYIISQWGIEPNPEKVSALDQMGLIRDLKGVLLMDKRRIHLRSASVRTYTFFTTGPPRFLSIYRARGLQAFDLPLLTNYSNPREND